MIENEDFEQLIKTYDRKTALFYLDPPYYDAEKYYPDRFQPEDHMRLKNALKKIQANSFCPIMTVQRLGSYIRDIGLSSQTAMIIWQPRQNPEDTGS